MTFWDLQKRVIPMCCHHESGSFVHIPASLWVSSAPIHSMSFGGAVMAQPAGLKCRFAIELGTRSHRIIVVTSLYRFHHSAKSTACTGHGEADGPQAAVMLNSLTCLGDPCPYSHPYPHCWGGKGLKQGCAASTEPVRCSKGKLSWSKASLHHIRPNPNCLESRAYPGEEGEAAPVSLSGASGPTLTTNPKQQSLVRSSILPSRAGGC